MTLNAGLPPKSSIVVPQALHSIASSQPPPIHTSNENQRRAGSTGQRRQIPSPRNGQHLKPRHKTRRPRLDDADTMAEATAIRAASSRRGQTSITHLMNFSLPPRRHLSSVEPLARHKQRQTQISWHGDKTRWGFREVQSLLLLNVPDTYVQIIGLWWTPVPVMTKQMWMLASTGMMFGRYSLMHSTRPPVVPSASPCQ